MATPFRVDVCEDFLGQIKALGTRDTVEGGCLHWGVGTAQLEASPRERVENLVEVNRPRGTGYSAIISGGIVYRMQPWRKVVGHAGGPNATVEFPNTRLYGVCIAYIGPSQRPRGIRGEVRGPHHKLGEAWYPPIDRRDVLLAAWCMRQLRDEGLTQVWGHSEINTQGGHPDAPPAKSDPFPVQMDDFRQLVLDDEYWRAARDKHAAMA